QALEKVHISDTGVWLPGKKQVFVPDDKLEKISAGKQTFDKMSNIRLTELISGFKYDTIMQMWNRRQELYQKFLGIKRKASIPLRGEPPHGRCSSSSRTTWAVPMP